MTRPRVRRTRLWGFLTGLRRLLYASAPVNHERIIARCPVLFLIIMTSLIVSTQTVWAQQPAGKKTIAVLPLNPTGVSPTEASALTNSLVDELFQTNSFIVIERTRVDELIKEQGLSQSGCVDNTCVAEVGKLLGAQIMVAGNVDKLGQRFSVGARLVEVETGRVLNSKRIDYRGEIEGLLDEMKKLAQALASPTPTPGSVTPAPAPTPTPTTPPPSTPASPSPSRAPLPPPRFQLQIVPNPTDAVVYIDGQRVGQGPVTRTLPPGTHTVRVTRNKFVTWEQTIDLSQNQNLTATLRPEVIVAKAKGSKKWVWGVVGGVVAASGGATAAMLSGKPPVTPPPRVPGLGPPPAPP